jgi:hypothetical protein
MKIKIKEGKMPEPKYSDYQLDDMETDRVMVRLLDEILGQLKVLNLTMTDADSTGESEYEKATAGLTVAENQNPWDKEPTPNPKGRSPIRPQDADMVFKSNEKTYSLAWNHVRLPWGADLKWTMNLKKNVDQNRTMLVIPRDGIDATTKKPYSTSETVKVDMKSVKVDPEGRFMDIPLYHYAVKGKIALPNGDLIDTEGLTIATREEQVRLSRAYLKWPKVPQYRREQLEMIEDIIVETFKEMTNED